MDRSERRGITRLYRGAPSARFARQDEGKLHRGSTVAAAPGITTKATSLFIAISTYISHIYTKNRGRKEAERKLKRLRKSERERSAVLISLRPFSFSSFSFRQLYSSPSFLHYALARGETHTCSYVTVTALSR